ncbi:PQQ-dependent catabolism-associated CXXCW motif protein [Methylocapsa sp. D3K7]|uniref:rhodanese-like domain-containing protein n=1 Tax=Methylocapsa sp. D3K7 TaxID=3041435 RepID=UPI00244E685D|nr:rhodanese-like domain-containing protein [Methylocapsa sp. D3K7]WGJ14222.1 PQQ-dependent catabolism-associated CXXCW motif protein [Methylocapsa sp. D3K7]
MRPKTAKIALSIAAVTHLFAAGTASAEVPEPQTYWTGQMHSEVPATLSGARVIHAQDLAGILSEGKAILIDAAAAPRRPENLAPGAIWKPVPHDDIAGSIWLPEMGSGRLTPEEESFYRQRLKALTASDLDRPIVFYCHPQCWGSWNAAKRALSFGYRNIAWFPDGAEGWQDAGHSLVAAEPETPPVSSN